LVNDLINPVDFLNVVSSRCRKLVDELLNLVDVINVVSRFRELVDEFDDILVDLTDVVHCVNEYMTTMNTKNVTHVTTTVLDFRVGNIFVCIALLYQYKTNKQYRLSIEPYCMDSWIPSGTSFQFFPGGGKILTDFVEGGGGQNRKRTQFCSQNTKNHYFFNSGRGKMPPLPPPPNDVPGYRPE